MGFGQATVVYTLLTLLSAVTLSFQIVSTKVVAQQTSASGKAAVYRGFHRPHGHADSSLLLFCFSFRHSIADYLNLPDSALVALLASARLSMSRWEAAAVTFRAHMDFAVLPSILSSKEQFDSADRSS